MRQTFGNSTLKTNVNLKQNQMRKLLLKHFVAVLLVILTIMQGNGKERSSDSPPNEILSIQVTGKVVDENGSALPGVNILEKGTLNGTVTDAEGRYKITADAAGVLVFSFIGYTTQEESINERTVIDVAMTADVKSLQEIVVVGYGTQKQSSVVASISSVSSKEIVALPVPSVEQALQGRAAGVMVTNNGAPGDAPLVRIRGISSINYAGNPLYVVDGIVGVGTLQLFNNRDVESMEVLKDASSAAIYGSRASNGVVLVTTKKGSRDGKIHVNIDSYVGAQKAWRKLDLLNRDQYLQYGAALTSNAGQAAPPRFSAMNTPIYTGTTQTFAETETDWQKEMFKTAIITQSDVSLSGGNDKSRFFASAGYFKQDGIMQGTGFKRYNLRLNSEHQVLKRLVIGQTLFLANGSQFSEQQPGGRTQVQNMIRMTPYIPLRNPTNVGGYGGDTGADGSDPQNPVRAALQDQQKNGNVRLLGTIYGELSLIEGLKFRSSAGLDYIDSRSYAYAPVYSEGFNGRSQTSISDNRITNNTKIFTNQLTFDKQINKHYINAIAVVEYQTWLTSQLNGSGVTYSLLNKELNALDNKSYSANRTEAALFSYIGRLNYEYNGKYLLSATYRRDGYSVWAAGHKFQNFPSVGLGWRISEENFLKSISAMSEMKIRGSYGVLGSPFNPGYPSQQVIQGSATQYPIGGQLLNGSYYNSLTDKNLNWETTKMTNVGLDLGLYNNSVTFSAEYYIRNTENLIINVQPAPSTGYSGGTPTNVGTMKNWGYDFQLGYNHQSGELRWNANGNIGFIHNKVGQLNSPKATIPAGQNADFGGYNITQTEAGHPVQSFYGWKTDGIYQSQSEIIASDGKPVGGKQELPLNPDGTVDLSQYNNPANIGKFTRPGDIRFQDTNNDGVINDMDKVYLGSFLPKFTYGLNLSANYKGFDMTMFFQGVQGNKIYNGVQVVEQGMLRLFNGSTDVLNAWTPTNTNTDIPRAVSGDPNHNTRTSDRFIENGSYLRLKNLSIGYSIPQDAIKGLTGNVVSNLRIYVSSQNLFTITKYTGYDPEIGIRPANGNTQGQLTQGIDYGQYPQARTLMAGIQIGF
jgi:TonB-dependent starch-binding outer membrane protein SusC